MYSGGDVRISFHIILVDLGRACQRPRGIDFTQVVLVGWRRNAPLPPRYAW